jgi:hypothetical protein
VEPCVNNREYDRVLSTGGFRPVVSAFGGGCDRRGGCFNRISGWTDIMKMQMLGSAHFATAGYASSVERSQAMPFAAVTYFVSFILVGTMVLLNLFIGVIMNAMQETQRETELAERVKYLDSSGAANLPDEIRKLELQMAIFMDRLQEIRLRMEPPTRVNGSGMPMLPHSERPADQANHNGTLKPQINNIYDNDKKCR